MLSQAAFSSVSTVRHQVIVASPLLLQSVAVCSRSLQQQQQQSCQQQQLQSRPASSCASSWRRSSVLPSLRQRRPIVNGEAVAFHVNDLAARGSESLYYNGYRQPSKQQLQQPKPQQQQRQDQSSSRKALSRSSRTYESDLIVVLDMDECLIHSQFMSNPFAAQVYAHQLKMQRRNTNNGWDDSIATPSQQQPQQQLAPLEHFRVSLPDGDLVHVNIRPGLRAFLDAVTSKFETHIYTAATDVYANPVLDQLDPTKTKFAARWFRESCTWDAKQGAYVKNLSTLPLGISLDRVVLVDNNPMSFLANPTNGILVNSFYNDPADDSLPSVLSLLDELDQHKDVRPILDQRFRLKEALQELTSGETQQRRLNSLQQIQQQHLHQQQQQTTMF